ncbi:MAG: hypothetical protein JOZ05_10595 [Acetobacteraceae bacterium]|nr:hypothetical protein [Acetobacteraceae bacterium]
MRPAAFLRYTDDMLCFGACMACRFARAIAKAPLRVLACLAIPVGLLLRLSRP